MRLIRAHTSNEVSRIEEIRCAHSARLDLNLRPNWEIRRAPRLHSKAAGGEPQARCQWQALRPFKVLMTPASTPM